MIVFMIKCFFRAQLITCLSLKTQALESFWGLYRELLDNYLLFMPMSRLRVRARVRRPSQRCQARSELNLLLLTIPEVRTEVYLLLLTISGQNRGLPASVNNLGGQNRGLHASVNNPRVQNRGRPPPIWSGGLNRRVGRIYSRCFVFARAGHWGRAANQGVSQ